MDKPKFGFLGKPISYAIAGVTLGVLSIAVLQGGFWNVADNRSSANDSIKAEIQTYVLKDNADKVSIALSGVIFDEGELWGIREYDLEWKIEGEFKQQFPQLEIKRGRNNPSYLIVDLPRDKYLITLTARSGSIVVSTSKSIDIR